LVAPLLPLISLLLAYIYLCDKPYQTDKKSGKAAKGEADKYKANKEANAKYYNKQRNRR